MGAAGTAFGTVSSHHGRVVEAAIVVVILAAVPLPGRRGTLHLGIILFKGGTMNDLDLLPSRRPFLEDIVFSFDWVILVFLLRRLWRDSGW